MMEFAFILVAAVAALVAALFAMLAWWRAGRAQLDVSAERFNRIDLANERLERELERLQSP